MKRNAGFTRRTALKLGLGALAGMASGLARAATNAITPAQDEGPFYPVVEQPDKDLDLTRVAGRANRAQGEVIEVRGRVLDVDGKPVGDALVDVWQANRFGRYAHERDPNPAPLDPDFQGWGQVVTDPEGRYRFLTIKPGAYGAMEDWTRPPHIHFKVARRGFHELTTQMYFAGEPLNDEDRLLQKLSPGDQAKLVVNFERGGADPHDASVGVFDIVLSRVG